MKTEPKDWRAMTLASWRDILAPSIDKLGTEAVLGRIGSQVAMAAKFHDVEMRFNDELQALQVRRPMDRSPAIVNKLEELTPHEKGRLGYMLSWIFNGPEQGFCRNSDIEAMKAEIKAFCDNNLVPMFSLYEQQNKVVEPWGTNEGEY